jgi:hypothetical protein
MIQDKPEMPAALDIATTQIGANERRGRPFLLGIPGRPMLTYIPVGNATLFPFLEV